jgi:hypothetical protein
MEKEFVPYEQVLALKALGFNEKCIMHWWKGKLSYYQMGDFSPTHTSAPTYSQVFRWFREKYGMIFTLIASTYYYPSVSFINTDGNSEIELGEYETYEEAELACLEKLIEMAHPNK